MDILTAADMRAADEATATQHGVPLSALMENAGTSVARFVLDELPHAERVVVLAGKGNNGGDGMVAARVLAEAGCHVEVLLLGRRDEQKGEARAATERLAQAGPAIREVMEPDALNSPEIERVLRNTDCILDAVVGTGFKPPVRGVAQALGEWLAVRREVPVVSLDLPSGWDADSRDEQQPGAYRSNVVVTFTAPKLAHIFGQLTHGPIVVAAIGSPAEAVRSSTGLRWAGTAKQITEVPRDLNSNKGMYGHVAVITGARGRGGGSRDGQLRGAACRRRPGHGGCAGVDPEYGRSDCAGADDRPAPGDAARGNRSL